MTLEDFFTLTEMKDGLTAPARVHELVAVMQKEKECVVKNVGDATRQWAAVASTIAATENKDCLDLFIQLDGLWFIDRWLKDAQKFSNDTSDGCVEESITALLRALEKLQIGKEKSIASGIWITVNNLLDHKSSRVQDRARAIFDCWKQGKVSDAMHHDVQSVGAFHDASVLTSESRTDCVAVDIPCPRGSADVANNAAEPAGDEISQSTSPNGYQTDKAEDGQTQTLNKLLPSHKILDHGNLEDRSGDPLSTCVISNSVQENLLMKEKSPISTVEGTASTETHCFPASKGHIAEAESDAPKNLGNCPEKLGVIVSASSKVEPGAISSSTDATSSQEIVTEPPLQKNVDAKEGNFCLNMATFGDVATPSSASKVGTDDVGTINHGRTQAFESTAKNGECSPGTQQDSSGNESRLEKPEGLGTPFSQMEDVGVADDNREHSSDGAEDLRDVSDLTKPAMDTRIPDLMDRRRSDIELEYGIVDALEVARQVAQEVEREVVDYREPSCSSSSEKIMETDIRQPGSPDSINGKQDPPTEAAPLEDVPTRQNQSTEAYPEEEKHVINSDNRANEAENGIHELESSQVTEVVQEPEVNTEKSFCRFDLNQEVCSDDMDRPVNPISAPISVVSASRPSAASASPTAPLQFEGTRGWKGSAATSAFRPASPRRTSDGEKILEIGVAINNSKQRHDFLDIDLNVAEGGDEKVTDLIAMKQIPVSSSLHSGESSLEVGPRRSERPNLDLNRISDDSDAHVSDLRTEGQLFYPRNGHRSPSPASSSSSMQPSPRNFDLNDRPLFHNDLSDQGLYHGKSSQNASAYGGSKPGDPVISIMGTRVEVGSRVAGDRKDLIPHTTSLPNGKPLEPAMDANVARMGSVLGMVPNMSYTHSSVFGYNGLATAPAVSISSAMLPGGSIPYMVDSRGAPVVPQIVGSASAVPASYSQPPFIMSMTSAPLGLNGAGPSRPNLDLNSGFTIEGGSTGGLRQLFMPGQGRSLEEQLRVSSQPSSSSGVGGKRKEPESGWEPYSVQYKHAQPPWR